MAITTPIHNSVTGETQFWLHITAGEPLTVGTVRIDYTKYTVLDINVKQAKEQLEAAMKLAQTDEGLRQLMKQKKADKPSLPVPPILKRMFPHAETAEELGARVGENVDLMQHIRADTFMAMAKNLQNIPPNLLVPKKIGTQAIHLTVPKGNHRFRVVKEFIGNPDPWDVITATFVDSQGEMLGTHHALKGEAQAGAPEPPAPPAGPPGRR
jgi:hypothetical protein